MSNSNKEHSTPYLDATLIGFITMKTSELRITGPRWVESSKEYIG